VVTLQAAEKRSDKAGIFVGRSFSYGVIGAKSVPLQPLKYAFAVLTHNLLPRHNAEGVSRASTPSHALNMAGSNPLLLEILLMIILRAIKL
jgi:hypothetical protein